MTALWSNRPIDNTVEAAEVRAREITQTDLHEHTGETLRDLDEGTHDAAVIVNRWKRPRWVIVPLEVSGP